MAKVKKGAKINFYKFVAVAPPSSEAQMSPGQQETVAAVNSQVEATNRMGKTVNSIAKVLVDIKKIQLARLTAEQKKAVTFKAKYTTNKNSPSGFVKSFRAAKIPGFLESILKILGGLFKLFIVIPALKWLGDPKNQKKVKKILDTLVTIAKFIFDVAKFGVVNTIEGLYTLFSDETSWWEKLGGLVQAAAGLGTLLLGIRWLSNPLKLVTDFGNVLKFLATNLKAARTRMMLRRGLKASLVVGSIALMTSGSRVGAGDGEKEETGPPKGEFKSLGGKVTNIPEFSQGGWINGPMSGYPVSLDGGRSTSFIGHGKEYVARKSNGGAFVVPFNTPGTKTQPHLTSKRMGEAKRMGYKMPGFANGGEYLQKVKENDNTSGDNANKKIFLHWSGGARSNTNFYNGNGYHTFIPGSGQPVRRAKFGTRGRPYHTYGQNQATSAAIGVSGMHGYGSENSNNWGSNAITPNQYQGMAKEAAAIATNWGWKPSDITESRVRTHYEDYRDYPNWYHRDKSSHYRWDLNRLYATDPKNSGPNKIRAMIKQQMGNFKSGQGKDGGAGDETRDGSDKRNSAPWNPGLGLLDAITGNRFDFDGAGKSSPPPTSSSDPNKTGRSTSESKVERKGTRGSPFWTLAAVAGTEDSDPQAWADVAQSIYNRSKSGKYAGGERDIRKLILAKGQYEPTWKYPKAGRKNIPNKEWHNIIDAKSAAAATGTSVAYMERVAKALENKTLQKNAAKFVGGRTDFMGGNERPNFADRDVRRKENAPNNFFGWFVGPGSRAYGDTNPSPAGVPDMTGISTGSPPGSTGGNDGRDSGTGGDGTRGSGGSGGDGSDTQPYVSAFQTPASSSKSIRKRQGRNEEQSGFTPQLMSSAGQRDLLKQTQQRNAARTDINDRSQAMVQTAIEAVMQSNGNNEQRVRAAQQSVMQMMMQARAAQPKPVMVPQSSSGGGGFGGFSGGSGGGSNGNSNRSTAAKLGSAINAVGRIFS